MSSDLEKIGGIAPKALDDGKGLATEVVKGGVTPETASKILEAVKLAIELGNDVNATTDFGPTTLEGDPVVPEADAKIEPERPGDGVITQAAADGVLEAGEAHRLEAVPDAASVEELLARPGKPQRGD